MIGSWDGEMGLCDGGYFASHGCHGKGLGVKGDRLVTCLCGHYENGDYGLGEFAYFVDIMQC